MTVQEHIDFLKWYYKLNETIVIPSIWTIQDIIEHAEYMNALYPDTIRIPSIQEANDILNLMEKHHDCTYGTTWDTIEQHISDLTDEKGVK